MSVVHVRFGKGKPAEFITSRGKIGVNTAFGLYRRGVPFMYEGKLGFGLYFTPPKIWEDLEGEKEENRSEDGPGIPRREFIVDGQLHRQDGPSVVIGRIPNKQTQSATGDQRRHPDRRVTENALREWHQYGTLVRRAVFDKKGFEDTIYTYTPLRGSPIREAVMKGSGEEVKFIRYPDDKKKKVEITADEYDIIIEQLQHLYYDPINTFPRSQVIIGASKMPVIQFS